MAKSGHSGQNGGDSAQRILDVAERLVQTRGFNGFSYADIAEALHVTKASLHYHFPAKSDLGRQLIERYERKFVAALGAIDAATDDTREKLRRYAGIYEGVLRGAQFVNDRWVDLMVWGMLEQEWRKH